MPSLLPKQLPKRILAVVDWLRFGLLQRQVGRSQPLCSKVFNPACTSHHEHFYAQLILPSVGPMSSTSSLYMVQVFPAGREAVS